MTEILPVVYLARHGETAWTLSGQHTGLIDLPLTPNGENNARRLGGRLKGMAFAKVFTSPLQRASRTCELAGFGAVAQTDPDLVEWNYGQYGAAVGRDPGESSGLANLPRRLSGRRVPSTSRREGGPCGPACAGSFGKHTPVFQRPFSSGSGFPLVGARSGKCGQVFAAEDSEPERARL